MDSSLFGQNNFCFSGGGNLGVGGAADRGNNNGYGGGGVRETGLGGFPSGGLLDNYLKQQQREELGISSDDVVVGCGGGGSGGGMNAAFDAFMNGGVVGSSSSLSRGLGGGLSGLFGASFGGGGGGNGIMSSGLFNQSPSSGIMNSDFDSMDGGDRILLQRAMQGASALAVPTKDDNTWIGNMSGVGDPYAENGILGPWSATSAGLLGNMVATSQDKDKKIKKKEKNKPKRPLSAYNIFFKEERTRILEELPEGDPKPDANNADGPTRKRKKRPHGKIGFESLAKAIGQRWQDLSSDQVEIYKKKAEQDMRRYKREMEDFVNNNNSNNNSNNANHDDEEQHQHQVLSGGFGLGGGSGGRLGNDIQEFDNLYEQQLNKRQRFDVTSF